MLVFFLILVLEEQAESRQFEMFQVRDQLYNLIAD